MERLTVERYNQLATILENVSDRFIASAINDGAIDWCTDDDRLPDILNKRFADMVLEVLHVRLYLLHPQRPLDPNMVHVMPTGGS